MILTSLSLILISCRPSVDNEVKILSPGVTAPATLTVVGGEDKGEFLVGSSPVNFQLKVKNNSTASLTDLNLVIDPLATAAMKFTPDEEGVSQSPGFGGSCESTLDIGQECIYVVEYKPTFSGELTQDFTFTYKNLIDSRVSYAQMKLLAGEAASLIYEDEIINYDLGVQERTNRFPIITPLKITNVGGLTARDLIFSKADNTVSRPFKVTSNNCPLELKKGESCDLVVEFNSENYGPLGQDGDVDLVYTSNIRYDYIREPSGGLGAITGYFAINSTKIEGNMESTGLTNLVYDKLTVGNKEIKTVKIINNGFKESIIHYIDVYDDANVLFARCSKFGGDNNLVCQDPSDTGVSGTNLTLAQFPVKIKDNFGCLINYTDKDYTRDADGFLSIPGLRVVGGRTVSLPGEPCLFDITFWPSVSYLNGGNFNGYQIKVVYDSTWKNTRDMKNEVYGTESNFTFGTMEWKSAALLDVKSFIYGSNLYSDIDPNTADNNFLYDLGRIALISDPLYKQPLEVTFKNDAQTVAEIISVKDGGGYEFTNVAVDINDYYKNGFYVNCTNLSELGGECFIEMNVAPVASSNPNSTLAEAEENNNMFDIINGYPEQYKQFIVEYKDGALYEDDGSLRANRTLTVNIRSLLVRKGFLVYEDNSLQQGLGQQYMTGDVLYYFFNLKNAGTGGIPYISTIDGYTFEKPTTGDDKFIFEYVDRPGLAGENGADLDCYDFLTHKEVPPGVTPPPNTNAPPVLGAGQTCSLAVKISMRQNDVRPFTDYDISDASIQEWDRPFWSEINNTIAAWEPDTLNKDDRNKSVTFSYYDGDGIADTANGYNPDLLGYGNYYPISNNNNGLYDIGVNTKRYARLVPRRPYPPLNAVLCRNELILPEAPPLPQEWGGSRAGATISERCFNYWDDNFNEQASKSNLVRTKIKSEEDNYDYVYYAGTWKTGGSYNLSFRLEKEEGIFPSSALNLVSNSYTGDIYTIGFDSALDSLFNDSTLNFTFTPTTDGTFHTILTLTYENDGLNLIDEANLTYENRENKFKIKIRADSVSNVGEPTLTVQDYIVTYDPISETVDDTTEDGAPYPVNTYLYNVNPSEVLVFRAIREGAVFDKKKFIFTNNESNPMNDFKFNLRQGGVFTTGYGNTISGSGISISSNNCTGVDLYTGDSCEVIILFNAGAFEADSRNIELDISYQMTTETYYQENAALRFEARDPAVLEVQGITDENIDDPGGGVIQDSYPINLGFYNQGHPVVNQYPYQTFSKFNVEIVNTSNEKASFLKQWEDQNPGVPLPSGQTIEIYNNAGKRVEATRACFYGDDEFDANVDPDTKGFNDSTVGECRMNFSIDLNETYFGKEIDMGQESLNLFFYNNERASSDYIPFHFKGFVEPDKSNQDDKDIFNVVAEEDGTLSFEWGTGFPDNTSWGDLKRYRIFYSRAQQPLDNIFSTSLPYVDTTGSETNITIPNLQSSSYYYLKVAAIREINNKEFISNMRMSRKTVILPPQNFFYDYLSQALISKEIGDAYGTKDEVESFCSQETLLIHRNGANVNRQLQLINSSIYQVIEEDVGNSNYTLKAIPHWMADSPVNITQLGLFGDPFDCTASQGTDGGSNFFKKSCEDCTCVDLHWIIGGDGGDLPYGATVYTDDDAGGVARCYMPQ